MDDIQTRPFSKNYSGLINQTVIAIGLTTICVTAQELMKRRRRGKARDESGHGLGSRESWEFGYNVIDRYPSPPTPAGWPLSWVKQAIQFPEDKLRELRGIDAALYIRFLRACFWFSLLHLFTTFLILFPIHVKFSDDSVSPKSMTRASISSLVTTATGLSLLWIHICLLFWVTITWMGTLFWITNGAFKLRAANLEAAARHAEAVAEGRQEEASSTYYQHPHPQYGFKDVPSPEKDLPKNGIRLRTIMVTSIPGSLRNEKDLQEYFEYYMSRKVEKPSMGITSSTQPGFLNKSFAFLFNRAKRIPSRLPLISRTEETSSEDGTDGSRGTKRYSSRKVQDVPLIERVVVARKMTELASLLERREEILVQLETAHVKLANKALLAVKAAIERKNAHKSIVQGTTKTMEVIKKRRSQAVDPERGETNVEGTVDEEGRMEELIEVLGPFVEEFGTQRPLTTRSKKAVSRTSRQAFKKLRPLSSDDSDRSDSPVNAYPPLSSPKDRHSAESTTIWDALLSLPRTSLDAYQPLVNLSHLFRGKVVPSIDYYTAKLNLLTSLIIENRAKAVCDYDPVSTAFVTFADPADARRACKYLAVHPNDPLACLVTMAPAYHDIDWIRVMKTTYRGEFVKDWVVNLGVWGFTLFWIFPVSLLVGLVSIQNISLFWPSLKRYLDHHAWQSEVLQSFIPTLLVALLALLIPLILLLIAKKAHTIPTLSALHDLILTRYYKFLIVNVLVFFCVGTAALQSFLNAFRSADRPDLIQVVASSFPTAGPFYVGWLIFTTAIHGGFELGLFGLPLILYPSTSRQVTPRKRAVGIRPRTFNFYYWLPNHTLVIHVLLLFSVLNPFVLPFGTIYFFIQSGVLIHVYAKNYETDGRWLLIRIIRYSLDGLVLSQAVFLAYMVVLKKTVNLGLAACLIIVTVIFKLIMTRMIRAQYERDDILEANIICKGRQSTPATPTSPETQEWADVSRPYQEDTLVRSLHSRAQALTWKLPAWVDFSYATVNQRGARIQHRPPNPFGPHKDKDLTEPQPMLRPFETQPSKPTLRLDGPSNIDAFPWNSPSSEQRHDTRVLNPEADPTLSSGPVVPHPRPIPWDDQSTIDLPYDNPYYTRTINNVLWLPRNPAGVLDLDDTVELKVSIPVEPSAGRLGTWLGFRETTSPSDMSGDAGQKATQSQLELPSASATSEVNGTEEIELPPIIAKRVQAREPDIDSTLRHRKSSVFGRKVSGSEKASLDSRSIRPRRPSVLDKSGLSPYRSFSDEAQRSGRPRSASMMTTLQVPSSPLQHPRTSQEFGVRPDTHAQAEFVAENMSLSQLSLPPPRMGKGQNLSASQAIFHEVLEEERQALHDRLQEETAEAEQTQSTKSWLTSWMFRKTK
ncbi:hypothetical protein CPC08DRAFT_740946 [Agrocybe pediades]|nr:hypothetical protein CPC08DRAFT_740946 [Agrocybe pediades]